MQRSQKPKPSANDRDGSPPRGSQNSVGLGSCNSAGSGSGRRSGGNGNGSGGRGSNAKRYSSEASSPKGVPASTGATPSLTLRVPPVSAAPKLASVGAGCSGKLKLESPTKRHLSSRKKASPQSGSLAQTTAKEAEEALLSNARVTFSAAAETNLLDLTPRRLSGKSKRDISASPDALLRSKRTASSPNSSPVLQPSLLKPVEEALAMQPRKSRASSGQRVPTMVSTSFPPSVQSNSNTAPGGDTNALTTSGSKAGAAGLVMTEPLPPLTVTSSCVAGSTPVMSPGVPGAFPNAAGGFATGNGVKRPMTLLERRSGRERDAMSISCLSTLSVETIQDTNRDLTPADPVTAAPILRGWSRTVANVHPSQRPCRFRGSGSFTTPKHHMNGSSSSSTVASSLAPQPRCGSGSSSPLTWETESDPLRVPDSRSDTGTPLMPRSTFARLCASRGSIKLISYNLLADRLVSTDRYPSCPPVALGADYRVQLMRKELQHVQADILVFAEMSVDMFERPNLLGGFLRSCMNYEGDHLVITDQQGRPLCRPPSTTSSMRGAVPPIRRSAASAVSPFGPTSIAASANAAPSASSIVPAPPTSSRMQQLSCPTSRLGSNRSLKRAFAPSPSPSNMGPANDGGVKSPSTAPEFAMVGDVTPFSGKCGGGSPAAQEESQNRRTEMEGVAVFYAKSRFDLLESVPLRFNEIASADSRLTSYERKKLQTKSHNVALISVLRDRLFPHHVYLVCAVHVIWQRVEAQLWQSRVILQTMETLKSKYDVQWRDGKRVRAPTLVPMPAKGVKHEASVYAIPAVFKHEDRTAMGLKAEPMNDEEDTGGTRGRLPLQLQCDDLQQEQHAICILAGDFNADYTSPTLKYLTKGYVPADAPVFLHWRHGGGESGVGGSPRPPPDSSPSAGGDSGEDPGSSCSGTILSASSSSPLTPPAVRHASTATQSGVEGLAATTLPHPVSPLNKVKAMRKATSPPVLRSIHSEEQGVASVSFTHGNRGGERNTNGGGNSNSSSPCPAVLCTPHKLAGQHPRRRSPFSQQSAERGTNRSLWFSADQTLSCPLATDKDGDVADEVCLSTAACGSASPVHGNWCAEEREPSAHSLQHPTHAGGASANEATTSGGTGGSNTLRCAAAAEVLDGDGDGDVAPPTPAARRRKKAPNAKGDGGGGADEVEDASQAVASPSTTVPLVSPRKASIAKRRKLPGILSMNASTHSGRIGNSEGSSHTDGMVQSAAMSEAASSLLSNGLDGEQNANAPKSTLFTRESLGAIFNDAAARAEGDDVSADEGDEDNENKDDAGDGGSSSVGDHESNQLFASRGHNEEDAEFTPTAAVADAPRAHGTTITTLSVSRSNSIPSTADESDESESRFFAIAGGSGSNGSGNGVSCSSGVPQGQSPRQRNAAQCARGGALCPVNSSAPGVTHELRLLDAYEAYCRCHPQRVSAVNPSTNQEGKVLDHILYEPEHIACCSVLRLGELIELPTRNIPSDHYMIGALLIPRASLNAPFRSLAE